MLDKLNKISSWQAALLIAAVGVVVFASGLANPFLGDDIGQIVSNPIAHSVTNAPQFFTGGTFYAGDAKPMIGNYRPLMSLVFSALYSLFGLHAFYFHLIQLLIAIGSSIVLYLFFRYSFQPLLALTLALIFLVHPLNSQTVFALASLQDALYLFFGVLGLYILVRWESMRSLGIAGFCLLLSLFSKESGVLFVVLAGLYLFWWQRERLRTFLYIMTPLTLFWAALRISAIGFSGSSAHTPIHDLGLGDRLLTTPSILLFYVSKLVFPWQLASNYYWIHPNFSVRSFVVPLAIVGLIAGLIVYGAIYVKRTASRSQYVTYLFFLVWMVLGLGLTLQIVPLEMTASETWFYFPMAGLLGMVGVLAKIILGQLRINHVAIVACALLVLIPLGTRTAIRGRDWSNPYNLAAKDVIASPDNFNAYNALAQQAIQDGNYKSAETLVQNAIRIAPSQRSYYVLGVAYIDQVKYKEAIQAFTDALRFGDNPTLYEHIGRLKLVSEGPDSATTFMLSSIKKYPQNANMWTILAVSLNVKGDNESARQAIKQAISYGQVPVPIYNSVINNQPVIPQLGKITSFSAY